MYVTFEKKGRQDAVGCAGRGIGGYADRARGVTYDGHVQFDLLTPETVARGAWGRNVFGVKIIQFTHNRGGGRGRVGDVRAYSNDVCTYGATYGEGGGSVPAGICTIAGSDRSMPRHLRSLMNMKQNGGSGHSR